ncbi:hypothetical protein L6452_13961 [Arctium lappa]|uniref:Uncharacterized protein n=1 Tax=Arctium lappa TaxID=4217 RepID=A0ACB9CJQ5_ARCLA|nr:hypothetical protein L6452_13961 [Arctium lappa]
MRSLDAKTRYDIFRKNLSEAARYHGNIMKMKDIDLTFFPMPDGAFYYLVVFNLKIPSCTIIDNRVCRALPSPNLWRKYGYVTEVLNAMMKEVEIFHSMEADIRARILLQANDTRFERLEY